MRSGPQTLDRRALARTVVLTAAAAALPLAARAQGANPDENVVFTTADPGHWAKVKATHAPTATVTGNMLMVKTPHVMTEAHFIVSHTVVLAGGVYLGRKTFTPKDMPESSYILPDGYKGAVTVTSACNLHDLWAATITV